jgi:hypothetical protein
MILIKFDLFIIGYPPGTNQTGEELCLVDSCTTNTILRELKYFQNSQKE